MGLPPLRTNRSRRLIRIRRGRRAVPVAAAADANSKCERGKVIMARAAGRTFPRSGALRSQSPAGMSAISEREGDCDCNRDEREKLAEHRGEEEPSSEAVHALGAAQDRQAVDRHGLLGLAGGIAYPYTVHTRYVYTQSAPTMDAARTTVAQTIRACLTLRIVSAVGHQPLTRERAGRSAPRTRMRARGGGRTPSQARSTRTPKTDEREAHTLVTKAADSHAEDRNS
jgi:hypothetical protein